MFVAVDEMRLKEGPEYVNPVRRDTSIQRMRQGQASDEQRPQSWSKRDLLEDTVVLIPVLIKHVNPVR